MNKSYSLNFAGLLLAIGTLYPGAARAECWGSSNDCSSIGDKTTCRTTSGCSWFDDPPSRPPTPTVIPDTRIRVRNNCSRPVMVSVAEGIGGFNTPPTGFMPVAPGTDSAPLMETSQRGIYFYAESMDIDGLKLKWEGTAARSMISNNGPREYGFNFANIDRAQREFMLPLGCPGVQPFHHIALWMGPGGNVGAGIGNDPATASANAQGLCMNGNPNAGCVEYGLNDGQSKQWLVVTGNEGTARYYYMDPDHQTAITQAMNACFRSVPNCRILLEAEN